ncbi:Rep family protein, partial [Enterococcus faecium]|uniref:Rep family protein n=1 Tax=Enterococcus faecium TaxID=1352 RepID=UPI003CC53A28
IIGNPSLNHRYRKGFYSLFKTLQQNRQEYKKAHYHVIYVAKNPVTADSVRFKIKGLLGDKSVALVKIIVTSIENMYLYLTHESKDALAKSKYKYSRKDIKLINNFDIDRYITLDVEDKDDMLNEVCDLIDEHDLANMRELRRFVRNHGTEYNLPSMKVINSVLRSHTGLLRLYFDAVYQERRYGRSDYDKETGEIKG